MKAQTMKAATAAKKLGIYLPAAPDDFREREISRTELDELTANPPEWLRTLRADGPHPRDVVAHKLGISNSGLARGGVTAALTTAEIKALLQDPPQWLVAERATHASVNAENARVKQRNAERAARRAAE
ncbi:DUF5997 family protein [Leifsonia sp. RAF41]|uniref:DUF5997 family protein n=1 Tax=Leifsonia sp. RAF41 TaxID=3233056 RepID=UPI003F993B7A